jgi:Holliday junction DNA helicase RuvA
MIDRVEGDFLEIGPGHVIVNIGGLGIRVHAPRPVTARIQDQRRGILLTRLVVRDGDPQLYGFSTQEERAAFDALLAVSGVGPRIALAILSSLEPVTLALEAERGTLDQLVTVTGVGKKLASRIVLELKGKLPAGVAGPDGSPTAGGRADALLDASRALTSLGYPPDSAREAVRAVIAARGELGEPALDVLVREALVWLNRGRS